MRDPVHQPNANNMVKPQAIPLQASRTNTTRNRCIAATVIAGVLLGVIAYSLRRPNEPSYQGRGINAWLSELNSAISRNDLPKRHEAEEAVRATGAKAAPYIVAHLRRTNSAWRRNYRNLFPKAPAWLQRFLPSPREEFTFFTGSSAFLAIGPSAKPALITALTDDDPVVRSASASALGGLAHYKGTDIRDALPALIECLRDADPNVRIHSAMTLGDLGTDAGAAVPGLVPLLKEPPLVPTKEGGRLFVRSAAVRTLGKIGPQAKGALPALRPLLNDAAPYERSIAAVAIWRISSEVTNTLPVLIQALDLVPEGSRWEVVEGLEEMGPLAKAAVPTLLGQLAVQNTANAYTLIRITNALVKIDPGAALRAGIQPSSVKQPRR